MLDVTFDRVFEKVKLEKRIKAMNEITTKMLAKRKEILIDS